jgi:hypothetical protein
MKRKDRKQNVLEVSLPAVGLNVVVADTSGANKVWVLSNVGQGPEDGQNCSPRMAASRL